jgi:prevent-host-death family protein
LIEEHGQVRQINIHQAKTQLSRLVEEAMAGEEIIIAKAGKPMVRLTPVKAAKKDKRSFIGRYKGKIKIGGDFDAPLPPDIAKAFGADE